MASSRNSRPADAQGAIGLVGAALAAALAAHATPGAKLAVALSGGIDSMVLLDAAFTAVASARIALSAIHVHHGISPYADHWTAFCAEQCAARGVPLVARRLSFVHERGVSLEAQVRKLRYQALHEADADIVALAHHADDQAETLLLQLLRGAGPHGLAAMPLFRSGRPAFLRPFLALERQTLAAYARERKLSWIEDESNADTRYARNFLREEIAPRLRARFAGFPATFVRAAAHQADAVTLADDIAASDATDAIGPTGLACSRLAELSAARARNLLRWYLRREGLLAPSESRLADMLHQLLSAAPDARVRIAQDGAEIGRYRGRIVVHAPTGAAYEQVWHGEHQLALPCGVLAFEPTYGSGIAAAKLEHAPVTVRSRVGGERIRIAANRPTRTVKKMLQEAGIPVWERERLPLVWSGDALAAVPGIGVAVGFQAAESEWGWRIEWRPRRFD